MEKTDGNSTVFSYHNSCHRPKPLYRLFQNRIYEQSEVYQKTLQERGMLTDVPAISILRMS